MATITSVSESGLDLTLNLEGTFMFTLDPVSRTLPELLVASRTVRFS